MANRVCSWESGVWNHGRWSGYSAVWDGAVWEESFWSLVWVWHLEQIIADLEKENISHSIWKTGIWTPGIWEHDSLLQKIIEELKK